MESIPSVTGDSMVWHYEHGAWTERSFAPYDGDAVDFDNALAKAGYRDMTGMGDDDYGKITLFRRPSSDDLPDYLIEFSDVNQWLTLTAGTLPDALELMAKYAPIITGILVSVIYDEITSGPVGGPKGGIRG